ncbi:MAG: hypothetical protein AB7W16_03240 [Candidatus Obscuribacterales bacterium]
MTRKFSRALSINGAVSFSALAMGLGWHSPLAWTLAFLGYSIALIAIVAKTYRTTPVSLVIIYVVLLGALVCVQSYLKWFAPSEALYLDFLRIVMMVSIPVVLLVVVGAGLVFISLFFMRSWKCLLVPALAVGYALGSSIYLTIPFGIDRAMEQLVVSRAEQAMVPVIGAIRAYQWDSGNAPPSIEALMPIYLSSEPKLDGIARGLRYSYRRCGNAWKLFLDVGKESEPRFLIEYDHEIGWNSRE